MTVQTSTNVAGFVGNGVTTSFPIAFKFNSSADLIVEATNTVTGVTTTLSLNSDYTVTGAGDRMEARLPSRQLRFPLRK